MHDRQSGRHAQGVTQWSEGDLVPFFFFLNLGSSTSGRWWCPISTFNLFEFGKKNTSPISNTYY